MTPSSEMSPVQPSASTRGLTKLVIVLVIVGAIVGVLLYNGMQGTMVYYITVTELKEKGLDEAGFVRLAGRVVEGSIERDGATLQVSFDVAEGSDIMPVSYKGSLPDTFKDGASIVAEGKYSRTTQRFEATSILAKCPSKYESKVQ